jgi:hypothetical protein
MNMANCVANTANTLISLLYDDEDDDLLLTEPGCWTHKVPRTLQTARVTKTTTSTTALKCVANATKNLISLLYDDEDSDLLLSEQGLTQKVPRPVQTVRATTTTTRSSPVCNKRRAASTPCKRTAKKPNLVLQKSYAVISVCTSGNDNAGDARRNGWCRKELKIVGVYTSKQAAESAKIGAMELYKRGHGDILAEGCSDEEIDMFIREDIRCMIGPRSL